MSPLVRDSLPQARSAPDLLELVQKGLTPYVPSPLVYVDKLYFLKVNTGILSCLDATTGDVHYQQRLDGISNVYASPVGAACSATMTPVHRRQLDLVRQASSVRWERR